MKVVSVVGNRSQFIKAAPLAAALGQVSDHVLVHTGQHYDAELSQVFFDELGLAPPDHEIEAGSGSHPVQTAAMLPGLQPVLARERPRPGGGGARGRAPGGCARPPPPRQSTTSGEAMRALVEVRETMAGPAVSPTPPRTRAALEAAGLRAGAGGGATLPPPLGYLEF